MSEWVLFTKRTDDPKLTWLEGELRAAGIPNRRNGHSFHAPILEVPADAKDAAWAILGPVDEVDDDDPRFLPAGDEAEEDADEMGELRRAALDHRGQP